MVVLVTSQRGTGLASSISTFVTGIQDDGAMCTREGGSRGSVKGLAERWAERRTEKLAEGLVERRAGRRAANHTPIHVVWGVGTGVKTGNGSGERGCEGSSDRCRDGGRALNQAQELMQGGELLLVRHWGRGPQDEGCCRGSRKDDEWGRSQYL